MSSVCIYGDAKNAKTQPTAAPTSICHSTAFNTNANINTKTKINTNTNTDTNSKPTVPTTICQCTAINASTEVMQGSSKVVDWGIKGMGMVTEIKGMGMVTETGLVPGYSWEDQATRCM